MRLPPQSGVHVAPVLLVQPTGGVKLSYQDIYSVIKGGVSLSICPLLSIGADQEEKLNLKALDVTRPILSIHLDKICCIANQQKIVDSIKGLLAQTHMPALVLLFSLPQAICNKKFVW
jgi:hypothetical protein